MLAEVVDHTPVEVLIIILKVVLLAWHDEHVEALACTDQLVDHTDAVTRMHVIIHIAMDEEQVTLEVLGELLIGWHMSIEGDVAILVGLLGHAMVLLTPPAVVDVVVMIAGARDSHLEEIRIDKHGSCRHEATT